MCLSYLVIHIVPVGTEVLHDSVESIITDEWTLFIVIIGNDIISSNTDVAC